MKYNRESLSNTLAGMLIFSDDFMLLCSRLGQGICFYKLCMMLDEYRKNFTKKEDIAQLNEHIAFYRNQLMMSINLADESLSELAEEDALFVSHIMTEASDAIGIVCDKLLANYGYGDIPELMEHAEGIDLSDFIVDFYHYNEDDKDDSFEEEDDEYLY